MTEPIPQVGEEWRVKNDTDPVLMEIMDLNTQVLSLTKTYSAVIQMVEEGMVLAQSSQSGDLLPWMSIEEFTGRFKRDEGSEDE